MELFTKLKETHRHRKETQSHQEQKWERRDKLVV